QQRLDPDRGRARRGGGRRPLRPAALTPGPRGRSGAGCNHGASRNESRRKKKKGKESEKAFFCFLLLFGIGTFQRVMSEKSKKNFGRLNSRLRLCASEPQPFLDPFSPGGLSRAASI
ncbi:MAG: hypothetical protein WAN05_08255, partial [Roseiarcus sp.]